MNQKRGLTLLWAGIEITRLAIDQKSVGDVGVASCPKHFMVDVHDWPLPPLSQKYRNFGIWFSERVAWPFPRIDYNGSINGGPCPVAVSVPPQGPYLRGEYDLLAEASSWSYRALCDVFRSIWPGIPRLLHSMPAWTITRYNTASVRPMFDDKYMLRHASNRWWGRDTHQWMVTLYLALL